jgi:hypothetical protein
MYLVAIVDVSADYGTFVNNGGSGALQLFNIKDEAITYARNLSRSFDVSGYGHIKVLTRVVGPDINKWFFSGTEGDVS